LAWWDWGHLGRVLSLPLSCIRRSAELPSAILILTYADCTSGRYDQAIEAFQQIVKYPSFHKLKDNAQYWLAERYYAQKEFDRALVEFQKVREIFPKTNKLFDAEPKIVYTYYNLVDVEAAKRKLQQLSTEWPDRQC
jgi:TolA-binding protein